MNLKALTMERWHVQCRNFVFEQQANLWISMKKHQTITWVTKNFALVYLSKIWSIWHRRTSGRKWGSFWSPSQAGLNHGRYIAPEFHLAWKMFPFDTLHLIQAVPTLKARNVFACSTTLTCAHVAESRSTQGAILRESKWQWYDSWVSDCFHFSLTLGCKKGLAKNSLNLYFCCSLCCDLRSCCVSELRFLWCGIVLHMGIAVYDVVVDDDASPTLLPRLILQRLKTTFVTIASSSAHSAINSVACLVAATSISCLSCSCRLRLCASFGMRQSSHSEDMKLEYSAVLEVILCRIFYYVVSCSKEHVE